MRIPPIPAPFRGEHLAATSPVMRPETDDARWRLRLEFWSGRALTAEALELEQDNRAGRLAARGRLATPGVVRGLEVALEEPPSPTSELALTDHYIHVLPGSGFLADGEDVVLARALRVALDQIPVRYVRIGGPNHTLPAEAAPAGAVTGQPRDAGGFFFHVDEFPAGRISWAAALVLCPAEYRAFAGVDPADPCELDASLDAFADERRVDASVLRLCELPADWQTRAELGEPDDLRWRNRLAHVLLTEETRSSARQQTRFLEFQPVRERWDTVLRPAGLMPWELLGVPIALLSAESVPAAGARRFFLDRTAVVRPGARARSRTRPAVRLATAASDAALNPDGAGTPFTWRARVDQFVEHIGSFRSVNAADLAGLAANFQFVPAVGFLPRAALDLLTTAEARALPRRPGAAADRAGIYRFFPGSFDVDAVPVALEDLDAALAAGAALTPFDMTSTDGDTVRILVPLPQRIFDPELLVVEEEDPIFAETLARFLAVRQGWRQRRDFVRGRRDALQALTNGPLPATALQPLDPGQLEPEPVEIVEQLGFAQALVSPDSTAGPWEVHVDFPESQLLVPQGVLFLLTRHDEDALPARLEARWHRDGQDDLRIEWTELPPAPLEEVDEEGDPLPSALWRRFTATAAQLGVTADVSITGFTLRVDGGRLALASAGRRLPVATRDEPAGDLIWWQPGNGMPIVFTGGDWTTVTGTRLLAPFEQLYEPIFPDGRTQAARLAEVEEALNPAGATSRAVPMSVAAHGLQRVLAELEAEASEADDFVDTNFTRAQVNLYRIRKLVLGETAAQKLLVNPAISAIAEQETAAASATTLGSFITAAKTRTVAFARVNEVLAPPAITAISPTSGAQDSVINAVITGTNLTRPSAVQFSGTGVTATFGTGTATSLPVTITIAATAATGARSVTVTAGGATSAAFAGFTVNPRSVDVAPGGLFINARLDTGFNFDVLNSFSTLTTFREVTRDARFATVEGKLDTLKDVFGQRPESGPTLPPRGLAIGERFKEPPATQNLSYARAALNEVLNRLPRLRLPLVGQSVRALNGQQVSLLALQGRTLASGPATDPPTTAETLRVAAINALLTTTPLTEDTDEAEVTLAALDFTEIKSAILRTIERVILLRRTVIENGLETMKLMLGQRDSAASRVVVIEGTLAEARHDVSVARALQQEERQRVDDLNARRDALIADEVRFLAYVRPRTVSTVARRSPYWELEAFGVPAPVPACLQRHDEPPPPLSAYIQLFRHAPVRWFPEMEPLVARLDTPDKLIALLDTTRVSALSFATLDISSVVRESVEAVHTTVLGAHQAIGVIRRQSAVLQIADKRTRRWQDFHREALEHASVGDLVAGRHGSAEVSKAAAEALDRVSRVATCLHAEFAGIAPVTRLAWIERFSQFDRPRSFRDLTVLPHFGRLDRGTRHRLQEFADWLFGRIKVTEPGAFALINDLVRLCLLLASHAPVNRIIAGHIPRPTPVRPGVRIPIKPLAPELVRVGMEFHVWEATRLVAKGRVEDLVAGEASVRVDHVAAHTTTLTSSMRVQFVAQALSFTK